MSKVLTAYQALVAAGELRADPEQAAAARRLDVLATDRHIRPKARVHDLVPGQLVRLTGSPHDLCLKFRRDFYTQLAGQSYTRTNAVHFTVGAYATNAANAWMACIGLFFFGPGGAKGGVAVDLCEAKVDHLYSPMRR